MAASSSVIPSPDIEPVEVSEAVGRGRTWTPAELLALLLAWDSMEKDHPQTKLKEREVPLRNKFTFAMEIIAEVFGPKSFVLTVRDRDELAQIAFLERRRAAVSELFKEYVCPYDVL